MQAVYASARGWGPPACAEGARGLTEDWTPNAEAAAERLTNEPWMKALDRLSLYEHDDANQVLPHTAVDPAAALQLDLTLVFDGERARLQLGRGALCRRLQELVTERHGPPLHAEYPFVVLRLELVEACTQGLQGAGPFALHVASSVPHASDRVWTGEGAALLVSHAAHSAQATGLELRLDRPILPAGLEALSTPRPLYAAPHGHFARWMSRVLITVPWTEVQQQLDNLVGLVPPKLGLQEAQAPHDTFAWLLLHLLARVDAARPDPQGAAHYVEAKADQQVFGVNLDPRGFQEHFARARAHAQQERLCLASEALVTVELVDALAPHTAVRTEAHRARRAFVTLRWTVLPNPTGQPLALEEEDDAL